MKLINPSSKKAFVNLFSDFILQKIGKNTKTIIQVTLYSNFILIYGKTDSKTDLDFNEIKKEFFKSNSVLMNQLSLNENLGTLNLIETDPDFFNINNLSYNLKLFNTKRPLYQKDVLNFYDVGDYDSVDWKNGLILEIPHNSNLLSYPFKFSPLQISSEFPYGYNLTTGRSLLYYAEYIAYNIFKTISVDEIELQITNQKDIDNDPIININCESPYPLEKIKSIILDNFDFDFKNFNDWLSDYDLCDEINNVTSKKPWLLENILSQDLIIL